MNILFVGTFRDKNHTTITGQTVVSDMIFDSISKNFDVSFINTADNGKYQRGSIAFTIYRIVQFIGIYFKLFACLISKNIDVIYYQPATSSMGVTRDFIAFKIIKLFKTPVVLHLLGYIPLNTIRNYGEKTWKMFNYIYDNVMKVIVEGGKMKSEFTEFSNSDEKVIVIPNGMNISCHGKISPKTYSGSETFELIYLSNLIFSKGYFDVLQALDILKNERDLQVKCVFAGKFYNTLNAFDNNSELGTREMFDKFIIEHKLHGIVSYYSGLYGKDKHEAFSKANAFILPSYYSVEGQPMSILEAMSYGCVPIVTAHGHIPMMVDDTNGCIVSPNDPVSIADAVESLIKFPALYSKKSKKSIQIFNQKFSGEIFGNAVKEVLLKSAI